MGDWRWLDNLSGVAFGISGVTLLINLLWFRTPRAADGLASPHVSVLVPARNEARSIEACARSLLTQRYPNFEVVVLNDASEDETGALLEELQQSHTGHPPFRLLSGQPLPSGWGGKNWACHQLAQAADTQSHFLLFTDADTVHAPDALARAVSEAKRDSLGLLSLMPKQQMDTWAEKWVVSLLPLQILGYLPLPLMEWLPIPSIAAANGQYLLFERAIYERLGGHAAYPAHLADDVMLAQQVKKHKGRVRLANGAGLVTCRMYYNTSEVLAGFRRSFAAGIRLEKGVTLLLILFNLLAYAIPFLRAPFSDSARRVCLTIFGLRALLAWRTRVPFSTALLHPLGIALTLWIQFHSIRDVIQGRQTVWRGRRYETRGAR